MQNVFKHADVANINCLLIYSSRLNSRWTLFSKISQNNNRSYLVILLCLFLTQRAQNKLLIVQIYFPDRLIRLVYDRAITTFTHLMSSSFIILPGDLFPTWNFASVNLRISSRNLQALVWRNGQRNRSNVRPRVFRIGHLLVWKITLYPRSWVGEVVSKEFHLTILAMLMLSTFILLVLDKSVCSMKTSFA